MANNKYERLNSPPPPMFLGQKERDLVKQVSDELLERVIGQQIVYYPISMETTSFHPLYGEAIEKSFLPPIRVFVMVEWKETSSTVTNYGVDQSAEPIVNFS